MTSAKKGKRRPAEQTLSAYLPADTIDEIRTEAERLDHSKSWIIQRAWRIAREEIRQAPIESTDEEAST